MFTFHIYIIDVNGIDTRKEHNNKSKKRHIRTISIKVDLIFPALLSYFYLPTNIWEISSYHKY